MMRRRHRQSGRRSDRALRLLALLRGADLVPAPGGPARGLSARDRGRAGIGRIAASCCIPDAEDLPPLATARGFGAEFRADTRPINATKVEPWPGAPLEPNGDPMLAGVGPGTYAERADEPVQDARRPRPDRPAARGDQLRASPPRAAIRSASPVVGADRAQAGIDHATSGSIAANAFCATTKSRLATDGRRVLLPVDFARRVKRRCVKRQRACSAAQFAGVPATRIPTRSRCSRKTRSSAYYGGGTLYATPRARRSLCYESGQSRKAAARRHSRRRANSLASAAAMGQPCAPSLSRRFCRRLFCRADRLERSSVGGRRAGRRRAGRGEDARYRGGRAGAARRSLATLSARTTLYVVTIAPHRHEDWRRAADLHQPAASSRSSPRRPAPTAMEPATFPSADVQRAHCLFRAVAARAAVSLRHPEPALRCVANARAVAETLSRALREAAGQTEGALKRRSSPGGRAQPALSPLPEQAAA